MKYGSGSKASPGFKDLVASTPFTLFDSSGLMSGVAITQENSVGDTSYSVGSTIAMNACRTATAFSVLLLAFTSVKTKKCKNLKITFSYTNLTWGWVDIYVNGSCIKSDYKPSSGTTITIPFTYAFDALVKIDLYETAYLGSSVQISNIEFC
jgi:hypothetical protein